MIRLFLLVTFCFLSFAHAQYNAVNVEALLPHDGIPWQFDLKPGQRVVVIGDVHGDLDAYRRILIHSGLMDGNGRWVGGNARGVGLGDEVDRGPNSRGVMDLGASLGPQARSQGGDFHEINGNHEVMFARGQLKFLHPEEKPLASDIFNDFTGSSRAPYAAWIRERNTFIQIGSYLFVHAGFGRWARDVDLGRVNATVRAWIRSFQVGGGFSPPQETRWLMDPTPYSESPLYTFGFKPPDPNAEAQENEILREHRKKVQLSSKEFGEILQHQGASHVFIGHVTTSDGEVMTNHPVYGDKLIGMDTGITGADKGNLSYAEIKDGKIQFHYVTRTGPIRSLEKAERFSRGAISCRAATGG